MHLLNFMRLRIFSSWMRAGMDLLNFNITANKEVLRMFLLLLTVRACLMICGRSGLIQS